MSPNRLLIEIKTKNGFSFYYGFFALGPQPIESINSIRSRCDALALRGKLGNSFASRVSWQACLQTAAATEAAAAVRLAPWAPCLKLISCSAMSSNSFDLPTKTSSTMTALDFTSSADAKVGDLTIKVGDMFSGNKLNIGKPPGAKMGNLTIGVGNVFSGNTTVINRGGKAPGAKAVISLPHIKVKPAN